MTPGGGEEAVVPLDEVVGGEHGLEVVAGVERRGPLLFVAGEEPPLDLATHALERGGGQHAFGRAADAEQDVGAGTGPSGGDGAGHVPVGDQPDAGARPCAPRR